MICRPECRPLVVTTLLEQPISGKQLCECVGQRAFANIGVTNADDTVLSVLDDIRQHRCDD